MSSESLVLALGMGMIGAALGFILGMITKRFTNPAISELQKALNVADQAHKEGIARLRSRLREYSQPPELQQVASAITQGGLQGDDVITMISNALPSIKGIPAWIRPMIPALTGYLKENPEQVQELLKKFAFSGGRGSVGSETSGDSL